jgi:hypothetical protein
MKCLKTPKKQKKTFKNYSNISFFFSSKFANLPVSSTNCFLATASSYKKQDKTS